MKASVDTKLAQVISYLSMGYIGEKQRAECCALLEEARAEIERQLPHILNAKARRALVGPKV